MYEEEKTYIVCLPFGWVFVGKFLKRIDFANNLFANGAYVRNAGQPWSEFITNGPNSNTVWAVMGGPLSITNQTLWAQEWKHKLPKA